MANDKVAQAKRNVARVWSIEAKHLLRRRVTALLVRGLTQAEIVQQTSTPFIADGAGGTRPNPAYIENPKTGNPYNQSTIHRIVRDIWREWAERDAESICDWRAEIVAHNRELERAAWSDHDLPLVLSILNQRAKLLGAFAPIRFEEVTDAQAKRDLDQLRGLLAETESSEASEGIGAGEGGSGEEPLGLPGGEQEDTNLPGA